MTIFQFYVSSGSPWSRTSSTFAGDNLLQMSGTGFLACQQINYISIVLQYSLYFLLY